MSSVGSARSKARRAAASIRLSSASSRPRRESGGGGRRRFDEGSPVTPARSMLADAARQRCARSWSLTIPASRVERGLDEPVTGCINCQFVERARYPAPLKQLAAFGPEKVDAPADAVEVGAPATVSEAEVAAHPTLNGAREQLCDQFGKLVRGVFHRYAPSLRELAVQV